MQPAFLRRRASALAVLVGAAGALLASMLPLTAAAAAPQALARATQPVPATPHFGAAIEPYSSYEENDLCDPVDKPGPKKLARLIRQTYGSDQAIGISRSCGGISEHNAGRALDWMNDASNPAEKARAQAFLSWLLAPDEYGNANAMARRLGVMYIIWNHRIWRAYQPGWGSYDGSNPHTDHIHISFSLDGASGRTSYWTGHPLAGPCPVADPLSSAPALVTQPMNFVPVGATRVLATHRGVGTLGGRCRLVAPEAYRSAPARVDAQVTGVGAVPATGVAAVALQVAMDRPSWASSILAGPTGRTIPSVRRLSAGMNQAATTTLVLPVGADGKVSFATSYGATDLEVSVVGYYLDPDAPPAVVRSVAADGGDRYHPVTPSRLLSGDASPVPAGGTRSVVVTDADGVDPAASAAVVSVTVRAGPGRGSLYVYPAGADRPSQPVAEFRRGAQTVQTTVPLGTGGRIVVESTGKADRAVDVDLVGAYEPQAVDGGLGFAPRRKASTVVSTDADRGLRRVDAGVVKTFSVAGATPDGTRSVLLQVSVQDPSEWTRLVFFRPRSTVPATVDVTAAPRRGTTATVVAPVAPDGTVSLLADAGSNLDLKLSVVGSFR